MEAVALGVRREDAVGAVEVEAVAEDVVGAEAVVGDVVVVVVDYLEKLGSGCLEICLWEGILVILLLDGMGIGFSRT